MATAKAIADDIPHDTRRISFRFSVEYPPVGKRRVLKGCQMDVTCRSAAGPPRITPKNSGFMKRLLDCIVASCGLIVLSPLFMVLAIVVKVQDGGQVFYRGSRVGLGGKPFRIVKFRTMIEEADLLGGPSTRAGDPRVTYVGKFLRKYKLDELPQLMNVLSGDMSLVGPRPEVQEYVDLYTDDEKAILTVRPGLTDWASLWNINEGYLLEGSPDPEKTYLEKIRPIKLRLQLHYVRRHTFMTDIWILVHTVMVLFRGPQGGSLTSVMFYESERDAAGGTRWHQGS
jgi:lipopolysaccharide/colanic/teichoic acid biosynthesis glycosyltransferase